MSNTRKDYQVEMIDELAADIQKAGFRVFIAEKGTYGFYTDQEGSRVISFQADLGGISFSGNYKSSRDGTGWRIAENSTDYKSMFNAHVPTWASTNYKLTNLGGHLAQYQRSSKYKELENAH